jgi:hypothetical protein
MTPAALRQLAALAEARGSRDLAVLDALLLEDRRLAAEILEIAAAPARDLAEGGIAIAPIAQQALRFAWLEQHIAALRRRRAELAPRIRQARAEATRSLGKHQALEHLTEHAEQASDLLREARSEREAMPPEPRNP